MDAGGWFDGEVGEGGDPKSISHETTFNEDTADIDAPGIHARAPFGNGLPAACANIDLYARTVQLKLRYSDFTTITRAHSLRSRHAARHRNLSQVRALFRANRKAKATIRLLGVHASGLEPDGGPAQSARGRQDQPLAQGLTAVDQLRDKFGEDSVSLATGLRGRFRERVHENPAGLPGKEPRDE